MRTARTTGTPTARTAGAALLATALLAGCGSGGNEGNAVPSSWIRQEYRLAGTGGGYVDALDPVGAVAREIDANTRAVDRLSVPADSGTQGAELLRYRNDIVAVTPLAGGGSRIEIDDYRTGYHRWRPRVGSVWPNPDSASFRGGGPGSGK
ncbi:MULTISPECIES: DUF4247 domain-containing protein [unclassified Streptomyces]|uniref:DUF4247 domain-containing protein n=1 Tax=unclassified Streptomyces TaxID=2593676 RepID=UPI003813AFB5